MRLFLQSDLYIFSFLRIHFYEIVNEGALNGFETLARSRSVSHFATGYVPCRSIKAFVWTIQFAFNEKLLAQNLLDFLLISLNTVVPIISSLAPSQSVLLGLIRRAADLSFFATVFYSFNIFPFHCFISHSRKHFLLKFVVVRCVFHSFESRFE